MLKNIIVRNLLNEKVNTNNCSTQQTRNKTILKYKDTIFSKIVSLKKNKHQTV